MPEAYRGRIAPSPTGLLHAGHAATFLRAQERAITQGGTLIYRNDDLDTERCKLEFHQAALGDLNWLGILWQEGPDVGGPHFPYSQSERLPHYQAAFETLRKGGWIYPCKCSRREVASSLSAPHALDEEPIYPNICRPEEPTVFASLSQVNWRFRIPRRESLSFEDGRLGVQTAIAGHAFGDFLVWRKDAFPSYQLACATDDALMKITEVVRGQDLITSTFRQILLLRALGYSLPAYFHCPLVKDSSGKRLAKRDHALALRTLRAEGFSADQVSKRLLEHSA